MVDDVTNRIPLTGPRPVGPAQPLPRRDQGAAAGGFAGILKEKLGETTVPKLQFSRHALDRLAQARRPMTADQVRAVEEAVDKAAAKGARDSLVLMRDMALVVSVTNRTVITAVDGERMKEQVFTNIDSAVIVREGK